MDAGMAATSTSARERILDAAYDLFSHHGLRAVGVDAVIERSGVAKMTLYRHFSSKEELVLAFLRTREERWTHGWLGSELERRGGSPGARLLAIFDVFGEWFQRDDFEGCSFINVLLETADASHPVHQASALHLATIRGLVAALARDAGVADADDFARRWHVLMKGAIVAAAEGDREAACRARRMGAVVLAAEGVSV
jgi:AcrR family transcriptional regulator